MACHTLSESARLAKKSRRTIQRYVKSGKLSAKSDASGNPSIDTSELIRVFGELSHPKSKDLSHLVTVTEYESFSDIIKQGIQSALQPLIDENKVLTKEMNELKQEIKHLTHRLDKPQKKTNKSIERPVFMQENPTITSNYLDDIPSFVKK